MRASLIRYPARCRAPRRGNAGAGWIAAVVTSVATTLAACGPVHATKDDALARLRALSAASVCRQAADCRTVPVGVKACGGPAAYIAVAQADLPAAQTLAQRYLQQRLRQRRTQPEPPSTCDLVQDPGAQCVENRCVTGNGGHGGAPRADR